MFDLLTTSLYVSSGMNGFDIVMSILFIIGVIYACVSLFSDTPQSNKKMKSYRGNTYYSRIENEEEYHDYDPSWDDAYFEKTGINPWFDDNGKK